VRGSSAWSACHDRPEALVLRFLCVEALGVRFFRVELSSESVATAQLTRSVLLKHLSTLLTLWASGLLHELEKKLLVSHD
jgi:hypothetical protein